MFHVSKRDELVAKRGPVRVAIKVTSLAIYVYAARRAGIISRLHERRRAARVNENNIDEIHAKRDYNLRFQSAYHLRS